MNWIAISLATLAGFCLGAVWYGPLFGARWMKLVGLTKKDVLTQKEKGKMMWSYVGGVVSAALTAVVLSFLIFAMSVQGVLGGMLVGLLAWVGFIATSSLGSVLWEQRPSELWLINSGYYLVQLLIMGAILGL